MTAYISREKGCDKHGIVKHELTADGMVIRPDITVRGVSGLMRQIMKPGDTWQETYPDGTATKVCDYKYMLESWRRHDDFVGGKLR